MARINIEDDLNKDHRFLKLVIKTASVEMALGCLVRGWIVAQRYWKNDKALIPREVWVTQQLSDLLLEVGLAELRDEGYYMIGSEEQFDWLTKSVESGKRGGKASAESRRRESNNLASSDPTATLKQPSRVFNPLPLSPSLSLSKKQIHVEPPLKLAIESPPAVFDFEAAYKKYPRHEGKANGMKNLANQIKTKAEYDLFITAVTHYAALVAHRKAEIRHVKMWSSFVGTKATGHPWREYVARPRELDDAPVKVRVDVAAMVDKILSAMKKFNPSEAEAMQEFLGPEVWRVYRAAGGRARLGVMKNFEIQQAVRAVMEGK